jgi:pyridoxine 4-dehydrogenase
MTEGELTAAASGVFAIGRNVAVTRLGLGAMRLVGRGAWEEPESRAAAVRLLRRAAELGVDFIDTADSYGPFASEELIRQALHPYRGMTVTTRGAPARGRQAGSGPDGAGPGERSGWAGNLRRGVEMSLRRLGLDCIDLYQLSGLDPDIPVADQVGVLDEMRRAGKIRHIGLCGAEVNEIGEARLTAPVACAAGPYHLADRRFEAALDYCEREGLAFIACSPLGPAVGRRSAVPVPLARLAQQTGTSAAQLALAWLLRRSPVLLPVPGTSSLPHLEENVAAAELELTDEQFTTLSEL